MPVVWFRGLCEKCRIPATATCEVLTPLLVGRKNPGFFKKPGFFIEKEEERRKREQSWTPKLYL
ncbi:hypothetical protein QUB12_29725 [Microcoleus sp. B7-D4]